MADVTINIDKFNFNRRPKDGDPVLEIEGSASGFLSQILTFLGLSTRSFLTITRREVSFKFSNLGGTDYIVCPMDAITCSLCGVNKPLWRLMLGILLLGGGVYTVLFSGGGLSAIVAALVGGGLLYWYVASKDLMINFSTGDIGGLRGLAFSAATVNAVIDGVPASKRIDLDLLLEVIEYINVNLVDVHQKTKE